MCVWCAAWAGLCVGPVAAEEVTVQVPRAEMVKVTVPDGWKHSVTQTLPSLPPTLDIQESSAPLSLKITLFPDPEGRLAKDDELKKLLNAATGLYVESSVEKKLDLRPLATKNGRGFYATFTDASLVEAKDVPAGQFRFVTSGMLVVGKQVAAFTLLSNGIDGKPYETAMQVITEGIAAP
jgi:hypothetical protein